jgi:hypothetical protein
MQIMHRLVGYDRQTDRMRLRFDFARSEDGGRLRSLQEVQTLRDLGEGTKLVAPVRARPEVNE